MQAVAMISLRVTASRADCLGTHHLPQRVLQSSASTCPWNWRPSSCRPPPAAVRSHALGDQLSAISGAGGTRRFSVPLTVEESVEQAVSACKQAQRDGSTRLQLELLLPLIGATDLDDWPGGIQQQFKAARPIVSKLLEGLGDTQDLSQESTVKSYILDDGDAVGVWESKKVALVLFPNADCLEKVKSLDNVSGRVLLLVNPQWQGGQVISDFGFGERRKQREEFVARFDVVYYLKQLRILGEDVRVLKCYPGKWQVFVMDAQGGSDCIAVEDGKLSYQKLQDILRSREGSKAGKGWFGRLVGEWKFNQDSLKQ